MANVSMSSKVSQQPTQQLGLVSQRQCAILTPHSLSNATHAANARKYATNAINAADTILNCVQSDKNKTK